MKIGLVIVLAVVALAACGRDSTAIVDPEPCSVHSVPDSSEFVGAGQIWVRLTEWKPAASIRGVGSGYQFSTVTIASPHPPTSPTRWILGVQSKPQAETVRSSLGRGHVVLVVARDFSGEFRRPVLLADGYAMIADNGQFVGACPSEMARALSAMRRLAEYREHTDDGPYQFVAGLAQQTSQNPKP